MKDKRSDFTLHIQWCGGVYVRRSFAANHVVVHADGVVLSFQQPWWITSMDALIGKKTTTKLIFNPFVVRAIARRLRRKMEASAVPARAASEGATRMETLWTQATTGIRGWVLW